MLTTFNRRSLRRLPGMLLCGVAIALLGGCSQSSVNVVNAAPGVGLVRPARVLVEDFAVDPGAVQLDQGIRARLLRAANGGSAGTDQAAAAQVTRRALTTTLVQRLRGYGLPAEAAAASATGGSGSTVIVQGRIVSVDEGNRTRRTLVGLGAGASSAKVEAQVFYVANGEQPRLLESFTADGDSGHAPGAAETMGVGAAAGSVAASAGASAGLNAVSSRRAAGDDDNARRVANVLAPEIGQYFARLGWIAPPPP